MKPRVPIKGRGSAHNPDNRFHDRVRRDVDDGWRREEVQERPKTLLFKDKSRSIIAWNQSPDVPFDRSVNPYRGCEHGCVYCFARPTHAYLDCSPGLDFETRIFYKPEAPVLLAAELSRQAYRCRPLALGVNTDAYQPAERRLGITRALLEVLLKHRHPVGIVTKSALVERDLDLLKALAERGLVHVMVSVTTLDGPLARTLEPRAASPERRLHTLETLSDAGVPCGVLVAPVIPFLNDSDIESILAASRRSGALGAGYVMIRLPHEVKDLFRTWLETHVPDKAGHIMNRIRDMRGGRDYDATFGRRMSGNGPFAELVRQRFARAVKQAGFTGLPPFNEEDFCPPRGPASQLSLF